MLIRLASALFALLNGRIASISGVLGGLLRPARGDMGWRGAFIAGLLVGVGTRYGSGCTTAVTGGVDCRACRLVRWSPRSRSWGPAWRPCISCVTCSISKGHPIYVLTSLLSDLVFGLGLMVSGIANPAKVLGFLDPAGAWDPSLALVMGGAIAVGFFAFLFAKNRTRSLLGADMKLPGASSIDRRLLAASVLLGMGWGVAGFCPGPGLVPLGMGESKALIFVLAMVVGMAIFELIEKRRRHGMATIA